MLSCNAFQDAATGNQSVTNFGNGALPVATTKINLQNFENEGTGSSFHPSKVTLASAGEASAYIV